LIRVPSQLEPLDLSVIASLARFPRRFAGSHPCHESALDTVEFLLFSLVGEIKPAGEIVRELVDEARQIVSQR
jgi:hypothetical protein